MFISGPQMLHSSSYIYSIIIHVLVALEYFRMNFTGPHFTTAAQLPYYTGKRVWHRAPLYSLKMQFYGYSEYFGGNFTFSL